MQVDPTPDFSLVKLASGVAGALVSLRFVQGTWLEKLIMLVGGSALSLVGTGPTANWLGMQSAEGLVGFLLGLFGMAIVSKVYDAIQLIDAKRVADGVVGLIPGKKGD